MGVVCEVQCGTPPENGVWSCPPSGACTLGCTEGFVVSANACVPVDPPSEDCTAMCSGLPGIDPNKIACSAGACVIATNGCLPNRADCNGKSEDGCEIDTSTPEHCGACNAACTAVSPLCSATSDGSSVTCVSACTGATPTQCGATCVNTTSNAQHCGGCDKPCTPPANSVALCSNGSCDFQCAIGFHRCGNECKSNTSVDACGTSCSPCNPPPNAAASCDGTACHYACDPGFVSAANKCQRSHGISAGSATTCVTPLGSAIYSACWGNNMNSQLGDATLGDFVTYAHPMFLFQPSEGLGFAVGQTHLCTADGNSNVTCAGQGTLGQLGNGQDSNASSFVSVLLQNVSGATNRVSSIASHLGSHTCVATENRRVQCWGTNEYGQLGDGTTTRRNTPVFIAPLIDTSILGALRVWAGTFHTCAADGAVGGTSTGTLACWGANFYGQLGIGTTTNMSSPQIVQLGSGRSLGYGMGVLSLGVYHSCAVDSSGAVFCWGMNNRGQLGDGTATTRTSPTQVTGLASGVVKVAVGDEHSCAVLSGRTVMCWGKNDSGQLGDGTTTNRTTPVFVSGLSNVENIAAGGSHTCAVTRDDGLVYCWGQNALGQLGTGTREGSTTPVLIKSGIK